MLGKDKMNKQEWEDFINKTRTGFSINEMQSLVDEIGNLRDYLSRVRTYYSYYKDESNHYELEHIAFRMDEAARTALGEKE
jgi:hypothetical protein